MCGGVIHNIEWGLAILVVNFELKEIFTIGGRNCLYPFQILLTTLVALKQVVGRYIL